MDNASLALLISCLSLVISAGGFFYTARTFAMTHRPYLAIASTSQSLDTTDVSTATLIVWTVVVQNGGSVPGQVTVVQNIAEITTADGAHHPLPIFSGPGPVPGPGIVANSLIMPNQSMELSGAYNQSQGPVRFSELVTGSASLDVDVRLQYQSPGLLGRLAWATYHYNARTHLRVRPGFPVGWETVSVDWN